jgi:hypothetical protein
MDENKLKCSTICEHIFCQDCICNIFNAQNKCPICWEKLNLKDVHHVYIQLYIYSFNLNGKSHIMFSWINWVMKLHTRSYKFLVLDKANQLLYIKFQGDM